MIPKKRAQSVSALCLVVRRWLWVQVLMMACFVLFILFLLPSAASVAEIIKNSHLFSQENVYFVLPHPKSAWSTLTFWLKYTMCCTIDTIEAVQ